MRTMPTRCVLLVLRASAIACGLLLVCPGSAIAQWYRTYEEGRAALSRGDYPTAEQQLKASIDEAAAAGVKPGRSVRTYGMRFINFVPDYYLGMLFAERGQQGDTAQRVVDLRAAEAAFSRVRTAKLDADREFAGLSRQLASVQSELAALTAPAERGVVVPPSREQKTESPPQATPIAPAEEKTIVATPLPSSGRSPLSGMPPSALPAASGTNLNNMPSSPPAVPPRLANRGRSSTARAPGAASVAPPGTPSSPSLLQQGIRAFFSGDYGDAARLLRTLTAATNAPPNAHFYLACSYGALALLREDAGLAAEARLAWQQAVSSGSDFVQERRFISPRILQLVNTQDPPGR